MNYWGIFDNLTGKTATLTPKSAVVLSAITVIAADGVLDEAELNDPAFIVRGDRKSINVTIEVMRANKFPGIIDLVAVALDEKQELTTLEILCDPAMADGVLAGEEKAVLQLFMDKFGIPEAKLPHRCDCHQERFLNPILTFFSGLENILLKKIRDAGGLLEE